MKIYILRHGHALPPSLLQNDFDRVLSDRGQTEIAKNFLSYNEKLSPLDLVWVSPLKRAQQTALEFCKNYEASYQVGLEVETKFFLQPDDNPEDVISKLQNQKEESILLITHQPLASSLIDLLCGTSPGFHSMATASMACIECEFPAENLGNLVWISHPT